MPEESDRPSNIRVVVDNSDHEVERPRTRATIAWPLRELAANMLRVVRGAGKSHEITAQCVAVLKAFQAYHDQFGHWPPSWEIDEALSIRRDEANPVYDKEWEYQHACTVVLRGGLQVAASRLVCQNTQARRGMSEMMGGVNTILALRKEENERLAKSQREQKLANNPKPTPKKKRRRRTPPGGLTEIKL